MKQNSVAVAVLSIYFVMLDYLLSHLLKSKIFTHFVRSVEKKNVQMSIFLHPTGSHFVLRHIL